MVSSHPQGYHQSRRTFSGSTRERNQDKDKQEVQIIDDLTLFFIGLLSLFGRRPMHSPSVVVTKGKVWDNCFSTFTWTDLNQQLVFFPRYEVSYTTFSQYHRYRISNIPKAWKRWWGCLNKLSDSTATSTTQPRDFIKNPSLEPTIFTLAAADLTTTDVNGIFGLGEVLGHKPWQMPLR